MSATAAPATSEKKHTVKITDTGPCQKRISIEIPAEEVASQIDESIETVMSETELPGFRKGRAPRRLVERRFGPTIRREAKNQLVAEAYNRAIEEHKIRVIGDPASEMLAKLEIESGKPLAFEIDVEVPPEFELPSIDGIEVQKPVLQVTDEMVEKEVERLLLNEGRLESKQTPGVGDYLTGHAVMKDQDGKVYHDIQDAVIQIPTADKEGKGMILGVLVDDFGKQLGIPKLGQTVTVRTDGPENHENEAIRGKKLTITFEVKRADEIIPAKLEEVAQRYGMSDPGELKQLIRRRIEQRLEVDQQSIMRQQIATHLMEKTTMELPERATAQQAARNVERQRMELLYRGVDAQRIEERAAEMRAASADAAKRDLKLFFILDKAAEKLDIKVSEGDINNRIAQIAAQRGERPEKLRQDLIASNRVGFVFQQIREHKTLDAILGKAKVKEVSVEEFNASMKAADGGAEPAAKKSTKAKK